MLLVGAVMFICALGPALGEQAEALSLLQTRAAIVPARNMQKRPDRLGVQDHPRNSTDADTEVSLGESGRSSVLGPSLKVGHPSDEDYATIHFTNASGGINEALPVTMDAHSLSGNSLTTVRGVAKNVVTPVTFVFLLTLLIGNAAANYPVLKMIPESAWTVITGVLLGFLVREGLENGAFSLHGFTMMSVSVLNLGLLPIIIFSSGWKLRRSDFISQFPYVLIYAVLGTVGNFLFIGVASHYAGGWLGYSLGMRECFCFAALISAVDPVATLATYSKLSLDKKQPLLNTLVFGESVINDAVAITLFGLVNDSPLEHIDMFVATQEIVWLLFGSIFFGFLVASGLLVALRLAGLEEDSQAKVAYIFISAYFVYNLSEACHFSGIISTLFAGIGLRRYATPHLTSKGSNSTYELLEYTGYLADNAVFILCGASTALIESTNAIWFGVAGFGICLVVRTFWVVCCSFIANKLKDWYDDDWVITWPIQIMMIHGGLRGGIALVLAMEINGDWCVDKGTILDATFVIIVLLLVFCGGTTEMLLRWLDLVNDNDTDDDITGSFEPNMTSALPNFAHRKTSKEAPEEKEVPGRLSLLGKQLHDSLRWLLVSSDDKEECDAPSVLARSSALSLRSAG